MKATIQPVNLLGKTATALQITSASVMLGLCAGFNYILADVNGKTLHHGEVMMPNQDYELWGTDDTYPIQYVAEKLGLTIQSLDQDALIPTPTPT